MKPQPPRITIMGFGNPVRGDDGAGNYVIELLQKRWSHPPANLQIIDMGGAAFEVLFKLRGQDKIIFVDSIIQPDVPLGTCYQLPASVLERHVVNDPLVFLHQLKWDQALSYARKILGDHYPEDISAYLIAIHRTPFTMQLSPEVIEAAQKVAQRIVNEVEPLLAVADPEGQA